MTRLARWRAYQGVPAITLATLLGISTQTLADIENGAALAHEDRFALLELFDNSHAVKMLLSTRTESPAEEAELLRSMTLAYTRTLARWQ